MWLWYVRRQSKRLKTRTRTHPESAQLAHKKLSHEVTGEMKDSAGNGTKAGRVTPSLMEPASEMETNRDHTFNYAPI